MLMLVQLVAASMILSAFVAVQARFVDPKAWSYLVANSVGAAALAILALNDRQWGFLLLEGVWALVSLSGLVGSARLWRKVSAGSGALGAPSARPEPVEWRSRG